MKTYIYRSIVGIFFGAFLAVVVTNSIIYIGEQEVLEGQLFLKNSLGFIFCGWFFTVSPLYFEIPNLRLSQQTGLHFITVIILSFILALGIGWIPFTVKTFLLASGAFIFCYFLIWIAFYLYFKNQAKKLNAELNQM